MSAQTPDSVHTKTKPRIIALAFQLTNILVANTNLGSLSAIVSLTRWETFGIFSCVLLLSTDANLC